MKWTNFYSCGCGHKWGMAWDCACNDRCENCGCECESVMSVDSTVFEISICPMTKDMNEENSFKLAEDDETVAFYDVCLRTPLLDADCDENGYADSWDEVEHSFDTLEEAEAMVSVVGTFFPDAQIATVE